MGDFYAQTFRLNGEEETVEEFAEGVAAWRAHFEDFTAKVDKLFTCGEVVVSRAIFRGRHVGDFRSVPATGRTIEVTGIDIFEFEGGRRRRRNRLHRIAPRAHPSPCTPFFGRQPQG